MSPRHRSLRVWMGLALLSACGGTGGDALTEVQVDGGAVADAGHAATATVTVDGTSVGAVQLVGRSNFESFLRASGTELHLVDRGCGAENLDLTFRPRSRAQPVTIEDVTFEGPDAFGFSPPELPLELGRGQYYLPEFRYASGLDTHRGQLTVRAISGGYSETHVVDVEGRYELEEIEGTQTSTALRDIMLVTDDLDPIHIDRLLEGVDALLDELERFDVDYQVGVIDTHDDPLGRFRREVDATYLFTPQLRRTSPGWLEDRIRQAPTGTDRAGMFDAMVDGLGFTPPHSIYNALFRRRTAVTHSRVWVFFVSDADDASTDDVMDYLNIYLSLGPHRIPYDDKAFAVSGGAEGCEASPAAPRLVDFVEQINTSHHLHSICSNDWTTFFRTMGDRPEFRLRTRFELPALVSETLEVRVEDRRVDEDAWTIDSEDDATIIEFATPPPRGASLGFRFFPQCTGP